MDDSIQTLKAEMNKLMSVYDNVKLKPEQADIVPATDMNADMIEAEEVLIKEDGQVDDKSNLIMTDAGRKVLEVRLVHGLLNN